MISWGKCPLCLPLEKISGSSSYNGNRWKIRNYQNILIEHTTNKNLQFGSILCAVCYGLINKEGMKRIGP